MMELFVSMSRLMHFLLSKKRYLTTFFLIPFLCFHFALCFAIDVPIYDFPISAYSQNSNDYVSPETDDYGKSLLSPEYQTRQLKQFFNHYYSSNPQGLSPWSEQMVISVLPLVQKIESEILDDFNNQNKSNEEKHYAENFKEHDQIWWKKIKENMNLNSLAASEFKEENRAISITNTSARALPDGAPDFFHASLPGQGFPFDNLQESAIWAGTPLYVLSVSRDKAWSLVLTPDGYFSWVKSNDIAYASSDFIQKWQQTAYRGLVAITQTEASIVDERQHFLLTGYIGSVFPLFKQTKQKTYLFIPVKNKHNQATIKLGIVDNSAGNKMPLPASAQNIVKIIDQLKNRPYGWGGAFFFNDCSQEMKSIFTPFGIWLPRNSAQQAGLSSSVDLSKNTIDERLSLIKEKGHPLTTLIYIRGHVMLYVGTNKDDAITYQNAWGMSPENRDKRYIIGQSLFIPLLKYYPENPDISSPAGRPVLQLVYLDELDLKSDSPQRFANTFFKQHAVKN